MRSRKKHTPADKAPIEETSDLESYSQARKQRDGDFAEGFETGYEQFKCEVLALRISAPMVKRA